MTVSNNSNHAVLSAAAAAQSSSVSSHKRQNSKKLDDASLNLFFTAICPPSPSSKCKTGTDEFFKQGTDTILNPLEEDKKAAMLSTKQNTFAAIKSSFDDLKEFTHPTEAQADQAVILLNALDNLVPTGYKNETLEHKENAKKNKASIGKEFDSLYKEIQEYAQFGYVSLFQAAKNKPFLQENTESSQIFNSQDKPVSERYSALYKLLQEPKSDCTNKLVQPSVYKCPKEYSTRIRQEMSNHYAEILTNLKGRIPTKSNDDGLRENLIILNNKEYRSLGAINIEYIDYLESPKGASAITSDELRNNLIESATGLISHFDDADDSRKEKLLTLNNDEVEKLVKVLDGLMTFVSQFNDTKTYLGNSFFYYINHIQEEKERFSPQLTINTYGTHTQLAKEIAQQILQSNLLNSADPIQLALVEKGNQEDGEGKLIPHYEISSYLKDSNKLIQLNTALAEAKLKVQLAPNMNIPEIKGDGNCLISASHWGWTNIVLARVEGETSDPIPPLAEPAVSH